MANYVKNIIKMKGISSLLLFVTREDCSAKAYEIYNLCWGDSPEEGNS